MAAGELMLYVSCAGSREIVRLAMDRDNGKLELRGKTLLPGPPPEPAPPPSSGGVMLPSYSVPMAVSPDGALLYAALRTPPFAVLSYRVDPATGALTPLGEAEVPDSTPFIHTDRSGRFLFGAAYQGNCIWISPIDASGLAGSPQQIVAGIHAPHCILPHRDNRYVYVAAASGDEMLQFRFDPDSGRLSPLDAPLCLPELTRPRHLAFHPSAALLYCITESHALIDVYAVDSATGRLTAMPRLGSRLPPAKGSEHTVAADLHFTPDGRFLYGSERTDGSISAFAVAPGTGALRHVGSFATDRIPRSFAIDPTGRFLVSAGQETGRLVVHAIDPVTGRLGEETAYEVGAVPGWVEFIDLAAKGQERAATETRRTGGARRRDHLKLI
jgi:6-phosphogluconolactonase